MNLSPRCRTGQSSRPVHAGLQFIPDLANTAIGVVMDLAPEMALGLFQSLM